MSVMEFPYRIRQLGRKKFEEYFCAGRKLPEIHLVSAKKILDLEFLDRDLFPSEISVFGKILNYSESEIAWHTDIFSGRSFPLIFSKKINIRKDADLSAKNVWEVNRLQFLPHISLNYRLTGEQKYLEQFISITNSWIDSNPYLIGINWYSNIEISIRLINWFFCWEILNALNLLKQNKIFERFVTEKWIPSIFQHCEYSYNNPSAFSSANNHLIAEYAGLFVASSVWKFNESERWLNYASIGLEKEIVLQHSNGINKEEAAEYIQFITDFFLLSFVVGERTNHSFTGTYNQTLKEIFEYILAFTDVNGNCPNYGDGDDGRVVCFSANNQFNNFTSLLTSAVVIFKDQRFKLKSTFYDLKNQILFGSKGKEIYDSIQENSENRRSSFYKKEGHFIFRNQKAEKEIYLHFNAAPLGYLSIAAHGHADALSIILKINGKPIFVDPGTYSYHVSKEWREYFVSTIAHNTVCIDGKNQAWHAGDTMWLHHYNSKLLSVSSDEITESVKAEYYNRSKIRHMREIMYNKSANSFLIQDEIIVPDEENHEIILLYHLHPDINVERISPNEFFLSHQTGVRLSVTIDNFPASIMDGQVNPVFGWYSETFMQKVPTNVICAKRIINQSFKSKTKIIIHEY
jgi:hypothetical protein